jgi:Fe2+ transport system protein FeoA
MVVRRAPLGEPIEITVRGSHLAMRNHEAAHILVTTAEA